MAALTATKIAALDRSKQNGKYADGRGELMLKKRELLNGLDPLVARKKEAWSGIETMDHLFEDWFTNDIQPRLKHPNIPARLYRKEIKPVIGDMRILPCTICGERSEARYLL